MENIKLEGLIENNTETRDINDGEWGLVVNGEFVECGDFLAELDIFLERLGYKETKLKNKLSIFISKE